MIKIIEPLNPESDGTSRTIKSQYYKTSAADFIRYGSYGATGVKEYNCINSNMEERKFRIRKLTPRECFRLMGVDEQDINKIQESGISKSQQYKMAGNSIVVDVLYYTFKEMLQPSEEMKDTLF